MLGTIDRMDGQRPEGCVPPSGGPCPSSFRERGERTRGGEGRKGHMVASSPSASCFSRAPGAA
jgi:hypothetical protein